MTNWHPPAPQEGLETPPLSWSLSWGLDPDRVCWQRGLSLLKDHNSAPLQETRAGQGSLPLPVATGPAGEKPAELLGLEQGWDMLDWDMLPGVGSSRRGSPASSNLFGCDACGSPVHSPAAQGWGPCPGGLPSASGCTGEQSGGSMAPGRHRTCHCPSMGMAAWGQADLAPSTQLGGEGVQSSPG